MITYQTIDVKRPAIKVRDCNARGSGRCLTATEAGQRPPTDKVGSPLSTVRNSAIYDGGGVSIKSVTPTAAWASMTLWVAESQSTSHH